MATGLAGAAAGLVLGASGVLGWGALQAREGQLTSVAAPAEAESVGRPESGAVTPALAPVDAWLAAESAEDRFSGVVLAARGDEVLLRKGYGYANRSWNTPFTATTKVQIASLTKQFTAAAILKLQDQGRLSVDDSPCRWIQPCPPAWQAVTLHQLMTHTAGIPEVIRRADYPTTSRRVQSPAEQTAASAALPLDFPAGTGFRYSNGGYQLLGDVIERASGQPYAAFLQEVFFDPLGMKNTGYEDGRAVLPELAQGYDRQDGKTVRPLFRDPSVIFSAGGLYSTADDLRTWTRALHAGRAISPEALAQMTGRAGPPERYALRPRRGWELLYAYGLMRAPAGRFVEPAFLDEQVFHTGSWNGFRLYLTHAPAADVTVVVLSNRIDQPGAVLLAAQKAMAAGLGRPIPERLAPPQTGPASD